MLIAHEYVPWQGVMVHRQIMARLHKIYAYVQFAQNGVSGRCPVISAC
ncbi:MAG: hypothetical protein PHH28_05445 [Desulfuromonadaceae bacterium]|nr:hypothetical protein [Desulfuromonadaceae bacterium]